MRSKGRFWHMYSLPATAKRPGTTWKQKHRSERNDTEGPDLIYTGRA